MADPEGMGLFPPLQTLDLKGPRNNCYDFIMLYNLFICLLKFIMLQPRFSLVFLCKKD